MGTQMQSNKESIDTVLKILKPEILGMSGYTAPPQGHVVAKLNQNENPYDLPEALKEEIFDALKKMEWSRYPAYDPPGVAQRLATRFHLTPEQVVLGNGSNQLLFTVINAVISKGDPLLISPPSFSLFELVARLNQAEIVQVLRKPDLSYDSAQMIEAVKRAKLTLISSPCNPTGISMDQALLKDMLENSAGFILWDEAYGEFTHENAVGLIKDYPNLLVMRTFSKAMALAGFRIGYLMGNNQVIQEIRKVNLPYNLNLMSSLLAGKLLDHMDWVEHCVQKIVRDRDQMFEQMNAIPGLQPYPSRANFILFRVPDGPDVLKRLQEQGVLVRNMGYYPMLDNCLRVNVGTEKENKIFLKTIRSVLNK